MPSILSVGRLLGGSILGGFSPASLFAASEPGGWYDPSDLTTLFQDAAGTTPVTAVEQPVGLVLDKSRGLVLGSELVTNGNFSNGSTGWTVGAGWVISGGSAGCDGTQTTPSLISQAITSVSTSKTYRLQCDIVSVTGNGVRAVGGSIVSGYRNTTGTFITYIQPNNNTQLGFQAAAGAVVTIDNISVRELPGNHLSQSTSTARPVLSARVNALVNTATLSTQNVTTLATNYTLRFEGTGSIALSGTGSGTYSAGAHTVTCTAGTLTLTVTGSVTNADLRPANAGVGLPAYQRVGAATDYDTTGFPLYLKGDGVDDHLLGPNISNLITVSDYEACVGARFNTVTTNTSPWLNQSLIADLGGYVGIGAARSTGVVAGFNFDTNQDEATVAMVAPATIVLQQRHTGGDIVISTNGGTEASAASGNTGNIATVMQVFRAASNVYTNGHIYGIVIRQTPFTAGERASIRDWMNSKTRAY